MRARPRARDCQGCLDQSRGVLRMRPFFLFLLRARADLSFAFWPGGMKNACFFASLMISSVITFRLKRRNALSIDSPWLTVTIAILSPSSLDSIALCSTYLTRPECLWSSTKAFRLRISVCHKCLHRQAADDAHRKPRQPDRSRGSHRKNPCRPEACAPKLDSDCLVLFDLGPLASQALDLDRLVGLGRVELLLEHHLLIKLAHHHGLFVSRLGTFHLRLVWPFQINWVENKIMRRLA